MLQDTPPEKQVRIAIKDYMDRHRRANKKDETEYEYSGSEDENEVRLGEKQEINFRLTGRRAQKSSSEPR